MRSVSESTVSSKGAAVPPLWTPSSTTATGTNVAARSRRRLRHQYIVAGASPRLSANSRTPSPLFFCAAISRRHFSSLVFVMPTIVTAGKLVPRWAYRALTENHLAWFVIEAVEQLDIDKLLDKYRVSGKGEQAYPPRAMLAWLIYSYCTGTFASRKIAAQIEDSVAFRVIAAGLMPNHRTICRFREDNLDEFQRLFVQVVPARQGSRADQAGHHRDRRQQGEREREQAQGDELRPHADGREEAAQRDPQADAGGA
jgi:transposase